MVEAPEKIWSKASSAYGMVSTYAVKPPDEYLIGHTEYLRSDIAESQIAELRAEYLNASKDAMNLAGKLNAAEADKARLSEALTEIAEGCTGRVDREHLACRIARAALSGSGAGGWRTMDSAPKDKALWLAWNPDDWTYGEGRMVDGGWIACGTFYDAKRKPPYRYGETKVSPVLWHPLPAAPTATGGR